MPVPTGSSMIDRAIRVHYEQGQERERLIRDGGTLELVRTQKLLRRYLPPSPATVLAPVREFCDVVRVMGPRVEKSSPAAVEDTHAGSNTQFCPRLTRMSRADWCLSCPVAGFQGLFQQAGGFVRHLAQILTVRAPTWQRSGRGR